MQSKCVPTQLRLPTQLRDLLAGPYKTLDDFRRAEGAPKQVQCALDVIQHGVLQMPVQHPGQCMLCC